MGVLHAAVGGGQLTAAELAEGALELARTLHTLAEESPRVRAEGCTLTHCAKLPGYRLLRG